MQCCCGFQGSFGHKSAFTAFASSFQTAAFFSFLLSKQEVLIRGQSLWDTGWKIWRRDSFFSDYFVFPLSGSFPPTLHTHFHLYATLSEVEKKGAKRKTGETWELPDSILFFFRKLGSVGLKKISSLFFYSSKTSLNSCGFIMYYTFW